MKREIKIIFIMILDLRNRWINWVRNGLESDWVTDSMWISLQWRALINSDLRAINRGCSEILWETEATYSGGGEAVSPRPSTWGRFARCFRTNSDRKSPVWGQGLGLRGGDLTGSEFAMRVNILIDLFLSLLIYIFVFVAGAVTSLSNDLTEWQMN